MTDQPKRTGRPPKAPTPGKRMSLGLKVTAEMKDRLDRAARASGRTQSQEAEARLERSFDRQDLLPELLEVAYGREVAGLLLALGRAMSLAGEITELWRVNPTGPRHHDDIATRNFAREQARRAAEIVLDGLWPSADTADSSDQVFDRYIIPYTLAENIVDVATGRRPELLESDTLLASARKFLKPIIKKAARPKRKKASQDTENG